MIRTRNLTRTYKLGSVTVPALQGVSLHIKKGEFVAIMGVSGSGKSTLLHQLGVIDTPTSGQVIINKTNVSKLSHDQQTKFRLKNLGFVFQFYSLLHELNVQENVALPLQLAGKTRKEAIKEALHWLKMLKIDHRAEHSPLDLSGGERQRVAIARALINKPKVLLADEPTANLDYKTGLSVIKIFRELNKKLKQTIVVITHERHQGKLADRVIELRDGKVV